MAGADGITLGALAPVRRWVAWQTEPQRGTGRVTKVPKCPRTLREAGSTRPATWGTRGEADAAFRRLPPSQHGPGGVGLVLGEWQDGHRIGGVDLDACRDPMTGVLAPWSRDVLALLDTYAEVSPSGTGVKTFFVMEAGMARRRIEAGCTSDGADGLREILRSASMLAEDDRDTRRGPAGPDDVRPAPEQTA